MVHRGLVLPLELMAYVEDSGAFDGDVPEIGTVESDCEPAEKNHRGSDKS